MMQNFHHISAFLVYQTFSAKIKPITRCISTLLDVIYNSVGHTVTEKSTNNGGHAYPGSTLLEQGKKQNADSKGWCMIGDTLTSAVV